ncbi:MAG: TaqI-like C-terminal specificity domain-containing protein [Spirochaetales bacterium]|nr:TaqI-like C-terminal specificity domain-containing protein [Spirochaetales bacterium]
MGMLNELFACRIALQEEENNRSQIKKEIVQNSIYGVDIEKGAVDIARLRFWLAIIVDENEPLPLPNLDYKIMQGNSLIESFEGIDLSTLTGNSSDLFNNDNTVQQLKEALNGFFIPNDITAKQKIRQMISEKVESLIHLRFSGNTRNAELEEKLKDIDLHANSQFFLWHTWFSDVFNRADDCNGFDIVIGNPPYVFARKADFSTEFKKIVEKTYFSNLSSGKKSKANQSGKINLFALFILLGINLTKKSGAISYIIPNNILRTTTYDIIRKAILDKTSINQIVDLGSGIFAKVTASTIILQLQKEQNKENEVSTITDVENLLKKKYTLNKIPQKQFEKNTSYAFNIFCDDKNIELTQRIANGKTAFGEFCVDIIAGIDANKSLISDTKNKNNEPLIIGKVVKRYLIQEITKFIEWIPEKINRTRPAYLWKEEKKIVTQRISGGSHPIVAAIDVEKRKAFASTNSIVLKDDYKHLYNYFLALLNSNVLNWYYANNFSNNSTLTVNISKTFLEQLPIPTATKKEQAPIINLVEQILKVKKENPANDTSELEKQIDKLVYELYKLSPEEIAIIENS